MDEAPTIYVIGLVAVLSPYKNLVFKYAANRGVTIGDPILEPQGVANRRAAVGHPFSGTELAELWMRLLNDGNAANVQLRYKLPANWRYVTP